MLLPAAAAALMAATGGCQRAGRADRPKGSTATVNGRGQEEAQNIYQDLDDSFFGIRTRVAGEQEYPDYYGGSYIDDYGGLVILATDTSNEIISDLQQRAKSTNFRVEKCEFSFNELSALNKQLGEKFKAIGKLREKLGWESVGIVIDANKVCIFLNDCTPGRIAEFKQLVYDSPMLTYRELKPIKPDVMQMPKPATDSGRHHAGRQQ